MLDMTPTPCATSSPLGLDSYHSNAYNENVKLNLQVLDEGLLSEGVFNQAATIDPRLTSLDWQWSAESLGIEMDTVRSMHTLMGASQGVSYMSEATSGCNVQTVTANKQVTSAQLSQRPRCDDSFPANAHNSGQIAIAQHARRSTDTTIYRCPYCEYTTKSRRKWNLRRHIEDMHTSSKPYYRCKNRGCNGFFKREDNLKAHIRKKHRYSGPGNGR
ncbi:hypothetical protein BO82DRAFT_363514 [Aspergillus uvarum CBS 121591]|uniref:C2H2-type domain-containing protein n=1 Tax=Aspergillus uvarum CBS 121591 TaxID=1448315 RepID=A0A319CJK1_9EURO|nr:hypothetical protein BO82DRAFT_363514 [Aspergillus uvarum CBS 121591]PYH83337.1 hypothetical protein BO82DRAFT_363514 [Aspergillus uvarum CBS 121591]